MFDSPGGGSVGVFPVAFVNISCGEHPDFPAWLATQRAPASPWAPVWEAPSPQVDARPAPASPPAGDTLVIPRRKFNELFETARWAMENAHEKGVVLTMERASQLTVENLYCLKKKIIEATQ